MKSVSWIYLFYQFTHLKKEKGKKRKIKSFEIESTNICIQFNNDFL
jgi:hypothetical protein